MIANGGYIGAGSFYRVGDAGTMLRYGSRPWQLCLFGLAAMLSGLALWNGLGPHFGFGGTNDRVSRRDSLGCLVALVALVAIELVIGAR